MNEQNLRIEALGIWRNVYNEGQSTDNFYSPDFPDWVQEKTINRINALNKNKEEKEIMINEINKK